MKRKWPIALATVAALVVCGFILFSHKSVLPIDVDKVSHIEFRIYPQDTPIFTVTDDVRVKEIVSTINSLSVEDCDPRPEPMGEYYYYIVLQCAGNEDIWSKFDENIISIKNENFTADTKPLHELLEKTYFDIENWNIE